MKMKLFILFIYIATLHVVGFSQQSIGVTVDSVTFKIISSNSNSGNDPYFFSIKNSSSNYIYIISDTANFISNSFISDSSISGYWGFLGLLRRNPHWTIGEMGVIEIKPKSSFKFMLNDSLNRVKKYDNITINFDYSIFKKSAITKGKLLARKYMANMRTVTILLDAKD